MARVEFIRKAWDARAASKDRGKFHIAKLKIPLHVSAMLESASGEQVEQVVKLLQKQLKAQMDLQAAQMVSQALASQQEGPMSSEQATQLANAPPQLPLPVQFPPITLPQFPGLGTPEQSPEQSPQKSAKKSDKGKKLDKKSKHRFGR